MAAQFVYRVHVETQAPNMEEALSDARRLLATLRIKSELSEREVAEVGFALTYVEQFDHGTPGHFSYQVIAKLARLLTEAYAGG